MDDAHGINSVTLAVRDLHRVAGFYRGVLGLGVTAEAPGAVTLGAGGRGFLHLLHTPERRPVDPAAAGLFHVAYLLPDREDLGGWRRHVAGLGLPLDGAADHLVSEAVYLHDPEGNGIEVYRDRPRDEWRWDGDGVVMANAPLDAAGLDRVARPWSGAPDGTRIGHVHLQVGAVEAAEPFYTGTLGLDVTRRWPGALFMSRDGYHHHLAANTWRSAGAPPRAPDRAGLERVALRGWPPGQVLRDPWGTTFTTGDDE